MQELHLDMCPLSTVEDIYVLRDRLRFLYVTNSGIPDLQIALVPIEPKFIRKLSPMILTPSRTTADKNSSKILLEHQWAKLETFRTISCGITCMDQTLHFMPKLTSLDMSYNDITHIVHLQDCSLLMDINLSHNRIRVLSNLERVLGNVLKLDLSHNFIESLDGLDKLHSLQRVDLSYNLIDDYQEIALLCNLPNLESIALKGNAIATPVHYRLNVFKVFLKEGTNSNGVNVSSIPALDGSNMSDQESYVLRGQMFKTTENNEKELSQKLDVRSAGVGVSLKTIDEDEQEDESNDDIMDISCLLGDVSLITGSTSSNSRRILPLNSVDRDSIVGSRLKSTAANTRASMGNNGMSLSAALLLASSPIISESADASEVRSTLYSTASPSMEANESFAISVRESSPFDSKSAPNSGFSRERATTRESTFSVSSGGYYFPRSGNAIPSKIRPLIVCSNILKNRNVNKNSKANSEDVSNYCNACGVEAIIHDTEKQANTMIPNIDLIKYAIKEIRQKEKLLADICVLPERISKFNYVASSLSVPKVKKSTVQHKNVKRDTTALKIERRSLLEEIDAMDDDSDDENDRDDYSSNEVSEDETISDSRTVRMSVASTTIVGQRLDHYSCMTDDYPLIRNMVHDDDDDEEDKEACGNISDSHSEEDIENNDASLTDSVAVVHEQDIAEEIVPSLIPILLAPEGVDQEIEPPLVPILLAPEGVDHEIVPPLVPILLSPEGVDREINCSSISNENINIIAAFEPYTPDDVVVDRISDTLTVTSLDSGADELEFHDCVETISVGKEKKSICDSSMDSSELTIAVDVNIDPVRISNDNRDNSKDDLFTESLSNIETECTIIESLNERSSNSDEVLDVDSSVGEESNKIEEPSNEIMLHDSDLHLVENNEASIVDSDVAIPAIIATTPDYAQSNRKQPDILPLPISSGMPFPKAGQYIGDISFFSYNVLDNLDMYFSQQVFGENNHVNYYLQHSDSTKGFNNWVKKSVANEVLSFVFCEDMLELYPDMKRQLSDNGAKSYSRSVDKGSAIERQGSVDMKVPVVESKQYVFVVTNIHIYILYFDGSGNKYNKNLLSNSLKTSSNAQDILLFGDAPVFTLLRLHPLSDFKQYTLFFSYQRCALEFSEAVVFNSQLPIVHRYMIITRDKPRTIAFITKLYQQANNMRQQCHTSYQCPLFVQYNPALICTCLEKLPKVSILNTEPQLLDSVHRFLHEYVSSQQALGHDSYSSDDNEVLYYQMLFQINANNTSMTNDNVDSGLRLSRSIILTPNYMLLCDEDLSTDKVQLKVIDQTTYTDIVLIRPEENPLHITIVMKQPQVKKKTRIGSVFAGSGTKRQWKLSTSNRGITEKLTQECRRLCKSKGNTDIK